MDVGEGSSCDAYLMITPQSCLILSCVRKVLVKMYMGGSPFLRHTEISFLSLGRGTFSKACCSNSVSMWLIVLSKAVEIILIVLGAFRSRITVIHRCVVN